MDHRAEVARADPAIRLKVACDAAGIGVWEYDIATTTLFGDARCLEMFAWPADTDGRPFAAWRDRIHPDDLAAVDAAIAATLTSGARLDIRYRVKPAHDDNVVLIHSTGVVEYGDAGAPVRVIGAARDLTEQAAAEAQLRESEARFRSTFDLAPNGMATIGLDGRVLSVNAAISRMLGYSKSELLALDWQAFTLADDLPLEQLGRSRLFAGEIEQYQDDRRFIRKDGGHVWASTSTSLIRDGDGAPNYLLTQTRDITEERKSQRWLAAALASMSDAVFIADCHGELVEFNDAFAAFHRFRDRSECMTAIAKYPSLFELRGADGGVLPVEQWPILRALRGETETNGELSVRRRDSGETWEASYNLAPIREPDGTIIGAVATARDVTAQRQTERSLRTSEQRLHDLFAMSQLGFVFGRVDGRFLEVNDAFARMIGGPRDAIIGADYRDLTPREWAARDREQIARLVSAGHCGPYEKEFRRHDGSTFPVQLTASLVTGDDGGHYFWAIVEDITERQRQSRAQAALAAIVESSGDAIISMDRDGKITIWNPAAERMLGYTAAEAVGQSLTMIVPPERLAETKSIQERIWRGEPVVQHSTSRIARGGREIPVTLTVWPVRDAEGRVIGGSGNVRDMTERNQIEAQLRQAQKMEAIGNLTGGLAHDFNNLLAVIMGNLDHLSARVGATGAEAEILADALSAAERGAELTRSLLAFARRQPLLPRVLRLDELVDDTARLLRRLLGEQIDIVTAHDGAGATVRVDPVQLAAALTNLATNARDAMPSGGKLTFRTGVRRIAAADETRSDIAPGDYAAISVQDNGRGIADEVIDHIYEPFFTTKPRDEGTGLGLSMVFGFMKQSGGHVTVASEPGVGTLFTLYLPLAEGLAPGFAPSGAEAGVAGKGEIILAVEDQPALRRTLARQLGRLGYRVVAASNAVEALQILETQPVDLLFSDVVMPGGVDGFDLAQQVRRRWPAIKMILTSGFPETRSDQRLPSLDIPLLGKPYRTTELAGLLRRVLDPAD